jgi:hypothetical protein
MTIPESHHDLEYHGGPVTRGSLDEIRGISCVLPERISVAE